MSSPQKCSNAGKSMLVRSLATILILLINLAIIGDVPSPLIGQILWPYAPCQGSNAPDKRAPTEIAAFTPSFTVMPTNIKAAIPLHALIQTNTLKPADTAVAALTIIPADTAIPAFEATPTPVIWATWTAGITGTATATATSTVESLPTIASPLLDRLARDKPSIWGNKSFYILLGFLYLTLFGLLLKHIADVLSARKYR